MEGNMILTNDQITSAIIDYILDKRYQQAIMLDGDWGSGKTFFVQEILTPKLKSALSEKEDKRSIYYISLYGIENMSQIIDTIYYEMLHAFIEAKTNGVVADGIQKCSSIVSKVITAAAKTQNLNPSDLPKIQDFRKLDNSIIIFDDLERCSIDVNRIFGFLNDLVEHNNIKVIIVANQAELGKVFLTESLPDKYRVTLNPSLKLNNNDKNSDEKNSDKGKITIDELKEFTEQIFAEDILYEKIKEKLIGITLKYQTNIDIILPQIIEKSINNKQTKHYVFEKSAQILSAFEKKKHNNLRTLIFALIAFEKFDIIIQDIKHNYIDGINEQREKIFVYCLHSSIQQKSGGKPFSWNKNGVLSRTACGNVYWGDLWSKDSIYGYQFVDDYLNYGLLSEENIRTVILKNCTEIEESIKSREAQAALSINKLCQWWYLEDDEIEICLTLLKKELEEKKYFQNNFKEIIVRLMQLEYNGFTSIQYGQYISSMADYLEVNPVNGDYEGFNIYSDDKDFKMRYLDIIQPLLLLKEKNKVEQSNTINSFFDTGKKWGYNFCQYCKENHDVFLYDYRFLANLDVSVAIDTIKVSTVNDIHGFCDGISSVYSFGNLRDFFVEDIPNINKMIQLLDVDGLSDGKITKALVIKKVKDKLQDSLKQIEM